MGGHISIENSELVHILSSHFKAGYSKDYGGSIYLKNCQNVNIHDNSLKYGVTHFDPLLPNSEKYSDYILSAGGGIYYSITRSIKNVIFSLKDL